jgi:DNA-binding IclR family transcriptional regulator
MSTMTRGEGRQQPVDRGVAGRLEPQSSHQSVDRALEILGLFSDQQPLLRVSDVKSRIGISDSTASRILVRLELSGFLERDERTSFYRVGPRILTLAGVAINHSELCRMALGEMHRLVHDLGLGVNLATLDAHAVFYLANLDGHLAPRHHTLLGRHYPLHATALGKVLIAWRTPGEVATLVDAADGSLARYTGNTLGTAEDLLAALADVRHCGYATEREELAMGRACVAAPVRGVDGTVVAGLSISGPLMVIRLAERESELASAVIDAAMNVSERLGFAGAFATNAATSAPANAQVV